MLVANIEQNGKKNIEKIFVIDAHSHLGTDIDGASMMNPLAPGTGTFDFWSKIQGKIVDDWKKSGNQSFSTVIDNQRTNISFSFEGHPFTESLFEELEKLGKKYSEIKEKLKFNKFIDQAVVFPFQDVFRDKMPEALYHASNLNISRFTTRFPFSVKLIGYARVDPMEGEKAVKEVKYAREILGLRGLKLHPRSEGWVEKVTSDRPIPILMEAIRHSMPIIFDTRGKKTIMDISELIKSTRNYLMSKLPQLLPHFKVIIAHFAQGNVGDQEVYNAIVQPNTYGDLSMLHGEGAKNFLIDFRRWFTSHNKHNIDNRDWSEYLLFATDYPYFGEVHAEKLLIQLINKEFYDNGGKLIDTKNILGLNLLRILPEYNLTQMGKFEKNLTTTIINTPPSKDNKNNALKTALIALSNLIADNKIDIKNMILEFNQNWNELNDNILLTTINPNTNAEIPLYLNNFVNNRIFLLAPLKYYISLNKFGNKYFTPEVRNFFSNLFRNYYVAKDIKEVEKGLTQIFN
ncbi:MAG: amidohydrolase family protein [Candidatus Lokiarchaeota archaeon]|nr:amidohydrolase family protein [Candidatus Lokiarchaeota archaeon]